MKSKSGSTSQMALPLVLGDKASFENYWVGHNSEPVMAIKSCIQKGEPRMLYLYGTGGSGKSHLLFAAMRFAEQEILASNYISLRDAYASPAMFDGIDVQHLVCVDDVHVWAGNEERERALFALFEQVKQNAGQLIVTASQPANRCGFNLTDLVSRLGSGLIYAVQALTDDQQYEAIKLRVSCRGLSINDDTIKYLLTRSSRDTTELFSILDEIDRASLIEKRRITIPFLQDVLARKPAQ